MCPYKYNTGVGELRTKCVYLLGTVVTIYRLYHQNEKATTRFKKVVEPTQKLYKEEIFDDYIFESFMALYKIYPTLFPGVVQKGYKNNRKGDRIPLSVNWIDSKN